MIGLAIVFIPFLLDELGDVHVLMIVCQFLLVFLIPFQDCGVLTLHFSVLCLYLLDSARWLLAIEVGG